MNTYHSPIKTNPIKTREDFCILLKQICDPIKPFYSKGLARLKLGNTSAAYSDSIAEMEGFSRILWGLVPYLVNTSENYDLWEVHLQGIRNGTNPNHEEYWGDINEYDQRIVEMAAFGLALLLIPEKVWDPLSVEEKNNFANWLRQINKYKVWDCNWLFFPVLVNLGLKNVGQHFEKEVIETNLNRIDDFYISNGWYSDGEGGHSDYYIPFAIHYFSLIYARLMEHEDSSRAQVYKERAEAFAKDFIYWSSADGSSIPYGRSMTYRFAQSAFWSAAIYAGIEPFPLGVMKGLLLRNIRWWMKQPIFNDSGILTIGYTYPNLIVGENYNSPGSPYWSLKSFLPLALPEEHPFWGVEEESYPTLKAKSVQKEPHFIIYHDEKNEHIMAFNSGHRSTNDHTHTSAKYEKFVYSNTFGFSVPRAEWGLAQGAFDSTLALSEGDNIYRVKRCSEEFVIEDNYIYTRWKPWHDVEIMTWIIPGVPWHVRIHSIHSNRELDCAEGGFALGLEGKNSNVSLDFTESEKGCIAYMPWGASGIKCLQADGKTELIYPNANTNLLHSRTIIPTAKTKILTGSNWLVSAVYGEALNNTTVSEWNETPEVNIMPDRLVIRLPYSDKIEINRR
ncbi:DUF2264 domain-containing protein [Bacillus sinesaloumensis]|uniref:DUF2264 domain-containing protein n=1 Tax=Litchfieldia sinesaloumensis TaxID=1926280 RepID=UPI000988547C|nr:DUF2264 domain-containing protein [Bacillus sinesaloumensis]